MRRETENRGKCCVTHCTKFMPESAINACMKVQLNISSAPGKGVAVPPPPGCRNSGKSDGECEAGMNRISFQRNSSEQGCGETTRDYSPTKQQLGTHCALTVRRRRRII